MFRPSRRTPPTLVPALLLALTALASPAAAQGSQSTAGAPVENALQETGTLPPTSAADSIGAPARPDSAVLVLRGDTLGWLYGSLGPYTVTERAQAVVSRLRGLRSEGMPPDSVRVIEVEGRFEVHAGATTVVAVTGADSLARGVGGAAAADSLAALVRTGLAQVTLTRNLQEILLGLLYTLLATGVLVVLLRTFSRWYPRLYRRIRNIQEDRLPSLRFQGLEILSGERIEAALLMTAKVSRFVVTGLLLFFYFPLVFSFFPPTRVLAQRIFALALEPTRLALAAVVGYLPNIFYIGVIAILTYYGLKLIRIVFTAMDHGTISIPGFYSDWALPTYSLIRVLGVAFAVVLIWPYLPNSDSLAFKGVAGFLGLLLTFGSAGAVSNVVGGVVMIYMRPFQIGDRVKIADTVGDVTERGMLVTRLRTPKNVEVTIPNSMVLGNYIVNYSSTARDGGVILHTTVTLGYDLDWREVHRAMVGAAKATDGIVATPEPFVLQTALGDYSVSYELNAYTDRPKEMSRIYSDLHAHLQDALAEAGIEILSPVYHALRDGNLSTIPAPHTPDPSTTPAFRTRAVDARPAGE